MTRMHLLAAWLIGSIALSPSSPATAGIVTEWNFQNNAIAVNNSPTASTGVGTASAIGMNVYPTPNVGVTTCDVIAGSTGDTGLDGVSNTTQIWRVRAQAGSNGAANGWSGLAAIGTQGAVFAASTAGFTGITVGFDWYTTNQGEANLQLQYTTDGSIWKNVAIHLPGTYTNIASLTNTTSRFTVMGSYVQATGGQDWFTGLTANINDVNAANDSNFAIRMVNASTGVDCLGASGTPLNNTSGNWRFDRVNISGNAVPEPSSLLLTGLAIVLAGLANVARRRNSVRA